MRDLVTINCVIRLVNSNSNSHALNILYLEVH